MAEKEYIEKRKLIEAWEREIEDATDLRDAFDFALEDVPAADVAEVAHGEWIVTKTEFGWNCAEYPTEFTCSVCGRTERQTEPYCHCGAKMDGERKERDNA